MRGARILGTGRALPPRVVTNEDFTKWMDIEAARAAIAAAKIETGDIDFIVFATVSPDYFFPGCGVFVQERLGLPTIGALDVRTQCTGFLYGIPGAARCH